MIRAFVRAVVALSFSGFTVAAFAADPVSVNSFDFESLPVNQAVSLYYKMVSKRPYFICNDVLADSRPVSIRASGKLLDGPLFASLLSFHGYEAKDRDGVTVVCKKSDVEAEEAVTVLYRVKYRDAPYLVDFLSPLVKGTFANKRSQGGALAVGGPDKGAAQAGVVPVQQQPSSGGSYKASGDDFILFNGSAKEAAKVEKLLAQLDVPSGEVLIKAYMYEVGTNDSDASALGLVMSALNGKVQAIAGGPALANLVRLKTNSIDLVASALSTDGRFKVVTSPFVRLKSGKTVRFVSGAQVSLLGAIVTNQSGSTQQSFDRVESGTILEVSPVVRESTVDVELFQQVSSFVTDGSGPNTPPTLNKRELRTALTVQSGEVVVIAGLDDVKEEHSKSGLPFLPFSLSKTRAASRSQLVLVLEVTRL